jgi:hypothetical protein
MCNVGLVVSTLAGEPMVQWKDAARTAVLEALYYHHVDGAPGPKQPCPRIVDPHEGTIGRLLQQLRESDVYHWSDEAIVMLFQSACRVVPNGIVCSPATRAEVRTIVRLLADVFCERLRRGVWTLET